MNINQDFEEIKKAIPELRDRVEIAVRMIRQLLNEDDNEHILVVSCILDKEGKGELKSVTHTSPGNGEKILRAALDFYEKYGAEAREETLSEDT